MAINDTSEHSAFEPDEKSYTPIGTPVKVGEVEDPEVKRLLAQFENLGYDCEFGLVQRRYGAEPLGLLRWSFTLPSTLIALLEHRFEGVGDPATTHLFEASWGELMLHDSRYDFRLHTFILQDGVDKDRFLASQCRRLAFLANKLREDLANGEKVFVYSAPTLKPDEGRRIHQLMRSFGTNALLNVRLADETHPAGTVAEIGDGLIEAYAQRYGLVSFPHGTFWDIDFDTWVTICRQAIVHGRHYMPSS